MRKKFDKSLEIDQARRAELVPKIKQLQVGEGAGADEAQFVELFTERKGSKEVTSKLPSAKSRTKVEKASSSTWGQTSLQVRAGLEEVAAALWHYDSRMNYEISGDIE